MRIFISWSGAISHEIATALHDWIPYVIQSARPFVSTGDIEKGRRWSEVLSGELSTAEYGIICVTADNLNAPWLHFEAGAVSTTLDEHVSPFLFGVDANKIYGPFNQFQFTVNSKDDFFRLICSINTRRLIHVSHASAAEMRRDFVMGELSSDHECGESLDAGGMLSEPPQISHLKVGDIKPHPIHFALL